MSAAAPSHPYDQLGLDAPFSEGEEASDRYESGQAWETLGESPYAEAEGTTTEAWNEDTERAGFDEGLAWLDVEAEDEGPQAFADVASEDEQPASEYLDDEERDAQEAFEAEGDRFESEAEAEEEGASTALTAQQRAWVLALDRSAIERLPDAATRADFLQRDWSDIEFPGNVPRGQSKTAAIQAHWRQARALFDAMAAVVPERRVPTTIRFRERPVVKVPGQSPHQLFAEARDAFGRMHAAAKADGVDLVILSSWRSRARQAAASAAQPNPNAVARKASAHMYGLAIDVRMGVPGLPIKEINTRVDRATAAKAGTEAKMGNLVRMYRSPVYKWLALRAREFGWYPYRNEPWHWEYNPPGLKARFEGTTRGELEQESPYAEAGYEDEAASTSLRTFTAKALRVKVAVYVTQAARTAASVDVLFYAHGLDLCQPVLKNRPASFINGRPFELGALAEASGRPIVLVVPFLDWERIVANGMAFGRKWHRIAQPALFNQVIAQALEEAGAIAGRGTPPTVQRLILSGHSRAYGFFDALAHDHASPHMRTGVLARPTHVWALDSTYSAPIADWRAWLRSREDLQATVVYRHGAWRGKDGKAHELGTGVRGREFGKLAAASNGRLATMPVAAGTCAHCAIPATYLPRLLAALPAMSSESAYEDEAQSEDHEDHEDNEDYAGLATEAEAAESEDETFVDEGTGQAGEDEGDRPDRFDAFGDARDLEWGAESGEEEQWQEDGFDASEQTPSFALDREEEAALAGSGLTPTEQKAVETTSLFETGKRGGFYGLSGNFDGQGLSFGLVNWTIGTGSLQPLLRDFAKENPGRWVQVFGADASAFLQLIARTGKQAEKDQHRFAIEQMNTLSVGKRGKRTWTVRQPWVGYFKRLSEDTAFRKIQVRYVRHLLASAADYCRRYRLTSELAFCFMFDTVSSHGKWWPKKKQRGLLVEQARRTLAARFGEGRVPEGELLLAIADVLATTSAQRWADNVRRRKRWFVTGQHPRGRELDGLKPSADVRWTTSSTTSPAGESEDFSKQPQDCDTIHVSDRMRAGAAAPALVAGAFAPYVASGRVDADIAHILNVMDGYPAGSWTKGIARFLLRELASGRLSIIVKDTSVPKRVDKVPVEGRELAKEVGRLVARNFPGMVAKYGVDGSALVLNDKLIRNGTQPGDGRRVAALTIAHETTHVRNRISMPARNTATPTTASFIDVALAERLGGVDNRDHFMGELSGNHVGWRVLKEIENKWGGRPIPAQPSTAGLLSYANSLGIRGLVDARNAYLDALRLRSADDYSRQVGLWVRDTGRIASFADPPLDDVAKDLFRRIDADFAPNYANPPDQADGAIFW
jgi:LAS superfamily LD-carboxypeptidase LdcB